MTVKVYLPNYTGGGIANLMASISHGMGGGDTGYAELNLLSGDQVREARSVLLLVIDGLGYDYLMEQAGSSELARWCDGSITSVCPSTTASAIPTFLTGVPAQQHGFTGWFTYFSELGSVLAVLPFQTRLGQMSVTEASLTPASLSGVPPLFGSLQAQSHILMPESIAYSRFNRAFSGSARIWTYRDLQGLIEVALAASLGGDSRNFIYAYWPEFDGLAHYEGVGSKRVLEHFQVLDNQIERLVDGLQGSDTLLLVTADHGFVDSGPEETIRLSDHPALEETLMVPLCGEPRLAYCYVHPTHTRAFERYLTDKLSHAVTLFPSHELLADNWFGLGAPHPRLKERIGHYTLVMNGNYKIVGELPGEQPLRHIGVHGGLSSREMRVPMVTRTL